METTAEITSDQNWDLMVIIDIHICIFWLKIIFHFYFFLCSHWSAWQLPRLLHHKQFMPWSGGTKIIFLLYFTSWSIWLMGYCHPNFCPSVHTLVFWTISWLILMWLCLWAYIYIIPIKFRDQHDLCISIGSTGMWFGETTFLAPFQSDIRVLNSSG